MNRVVLDTNVIVSGLLKQGSSPALALSLILDSHIQLCMTDEIFAEYNGVLSRQKFQNLDQANIKKVLLFIKQKSLWVSPSTRVHLIKSDPEDNKFLECASEAKADYLIMGNMNHFVMTHYKKTKIVSPHEFLYQMVEKILY